MLLYFFLTSILYIPTKLILFLIVNKYGKFSYDGFSAAGFGYDSEKKVFYSTKNAWQKELGYCHQYDVGAPFFQMIIDTEPIKFNYNNKNWLITFWKGQYGITTGAEIGVYSTSEKKVNKRTVYFPVNDDEMLDMSFILYKKGKEITRVKAKHWWLAIFKIGMFSKPKELSMDIEIEFPNTEILNAFLKSFKKLRHRKKYYQVIDKTFIFTYKKPKTHKVWSRIWISDVIRQYINKKNVNLYNQYLEGVVDDSNSADKKQIKLNKLIPNILKNEQEVKIISKNNEKTRSSNFRNQKEKNVIFLNENVYSTLKRNNK